MNTNKISSISFGYSHPLKTAFLKGMLPEVKYGIYGKELTKKTVSLEHIEPHSLGGKTTFDNLFLADRFENSKRGVKPIEEVITKKDIFQHLTQWINVKNKYVDGMEYIKGILKHFNFDLNEFFEFVKSNNIKK